MIYMTTTDHGRWIELSGPGLLSRPLNFLVLLLASLLIMQEQCIAQLSNRESSSSDYEFGFEERFNPSMAVVIIILICIFFFVSFFSICFRRCIIGDRTTTTGNSHSGGDDDELKRISTEGIDPSIIKSFPVFPYSSAEKDLEVGKRGLECAVCISEFEDGDCLRLLPKCRHVFHHKCIEAWLAAHTTCPVCRAKLTPEDLAGDEIQTDMPIIDRSVVDDESSNRCNNGEVLDRVSIRVEDRTREEENEIRLASQGLLMKPNSLTPDLPEKLPRQNLKRTTTCVVVSTRDESSTRGFGGSGEGSNSSSSGSRE